MYPVVVVLGMLLVLGTAAVSPRFQHPFQASPSGTGFEPPSAANPARLETLTGDVLQYARGADGFTPATPSGSVRQGETVATLQGAAAISIENHGGLMLDSGAEIAFISLKRDAFLFLQRSGPVRYRTDGAPFSVRISRAVVELSGEAEIDREPDGFSIHVLTGNARVGYVDSDNTTHVADIQEDSRAVFSNDSLSLTIR